MKTPYLVHCDDHGEVFLTEEQYMNQLMKSNSKWKCPICGQEASWDDENYDLCIEDLQ